MTEYERFMSKVEFEPNTGCWLWAHGTNEHGYGQFWDGRSMQKAHRVSFRLHGGDLSEGRAVCHKCDTPACVNPAHLWIGSQQDNVTDMRRKGRGPTVVMPVGGHCAKLTIADVHDIARMRRAGALLTEIARKYGLHETTIGLVVQGRTWGGLGRATPECMEKSL